MTIKAGNRVVVTGIGLITPVGIGVEQSWNTLLAGQSGIQRISYFDPSDYPSQIAGEVKGFNADNWIEPKDQRKMDRFIHFGIAASEEAIAMSGFLETASDEDKAETAVVLGSGIGGLPLIEEYYGVLQEKGPRRLSPFLIPSILGNLLAGHVSIRYKLGGPNICTVSACASGAHAIIDAYRMIRDGESIAAVAGGAESSVSRLAVGGFAAAKSLSTAFNDTPEAASRPFDDARDGFVIGEGAGVLFLEDYEHAKKRGATILAEVSGFGQTGDAYHITTPSGVGGVRAMTKSLATAQLNAEDVDYINAHATSTVIGDKMESQGIEEVFGKKIVVSATKSMTGHLLGAAGSTEAAYAVLSIRDQKVAPTINLQNPSEGCTLDYVPNVARDLKINHALTNSFGFGGTNASLLFSKV